MKKSRRMKKGRLTMKRSDRNWKVVGEHKKRLLNSFPSLLLPSFLLPSWLLGSWLIFCFSSFVYEHHSPFFFLFFLFWIPLSSFFIFFFTIDIVRKINKKLKNYLIKTRVPIKPNPQSTQPLFPFVSFSSLLKMCQKLPS